MKHMEAAFDTLPDYWIRKSYLRIVERAVNAALEVQAAELEAENERLRTGATKDDLPSIINDLKIEIEEEGASTRVGENMQAAIDVLEFQADRIAELEAENEQLRQAVDDLEYLKNMYRDDAADARLGQRAFEKRTEELAALVVKLSDEAQTDNT